MFQQLKIQKESLLQAPSSPTNTNKLHQYFESSTFLSQQEDLALFIKDLPIIHLKNMKSVNNLISLLIKQNQLVGQKCQQQISLLKQQYLKHDKLIRNSKQVKIENQKLQREKRALQQELSAVKISKSNDVVRHQQLQTIQRKFQAETIKNNALLKDANERISKFQQLLSLISLEEYKKSQEFLRNSVQQLKIKQNIEQYLQSQRKRSKYLIRVKQIVEQFCVRLDKITKFVSPTLLASQLNIQTSNMMQLINQLIQNDKIKKKRKKTEGGSEKNLSISQFGVSSQKNLGFFEGMIHKLAESASNNSTAKQVIASQLEEVKSSLHQSKSYYETALKNLKQQFKQKEEQVNKKLNLKQQTIKFYEEQIQKSRQTIDTYQKQNDSLSNSLNTLKRELETKNIYNQSLETKLQQAYKQNKEDVDRIREECQSRISELKKISALKIEQREQMLNEQTQRRKKQLNDHEIELKELKSKVKVLQEQNEEKQRKLRTHMLNQKALQNQFERAGNISRDLQLQISKTKKQINEFQQKLNKKNRQIQQFKDTLSSIQHEKTLQSAYITQLENKIQTLNNKFKSLQAKTKNDVTNKKEITAMKNTIVEQKQRNEQFQMYCVQVKEQNQRLKAVVKQMKKELEEVYVRLSELKQIEGERQRLFIEVQNSERAKQLIMKQFEEMKFQMLKLEGENKKMHLELKHFRNVVNRIKFAEEIDI